MDNVLKDNRIEEQININHAFCPAGIDTKKRLYVKKVKGGGNTVHLFYCHHCGNRGSVKYRGLSRVEDVALESSEHTKSSAVELLKALEKCRHGSTGIWHIDAKLWWHKYSLDMLDAVTHHVQYNSVDKRLWLKVADGLWQGRGFGTDAKRMKYYTVGDVNASVVYVRNPNSTVMLVEDVISAYKCAKAGINVLPLLGTSLRSHHLNLIKPYKRVMVYMDNDDAGKMASVKIYKELTPYANDIDVIYDDRQPKERPINELEFYAKI
jgi:hypothetical protein